jgi:acetyl-CoA carboxylase biotin carboxyl carrier protein
MPTPFDAEAVRALATILTETGLTEIEVEAKDLRIRVVRAPAVLASSHTVMPMAATQQAALPPAAAVVMAEDDALHPGAVLSPMVGIAYLAPDPGSPPYVNLGQAVAAGQTVLLIEAMKTFNQIKSPKAGTVTRILVTPGAPVEYGEPLLIVE